MMKKKNIQGIYKTLFCSISIPQNTYLRNPLINVFPLCSTTPMIEIFEKQLQRWWVLMNCKFANHSFQKD